ncbi:hypothetical protein PHMEG_00012163 [Phytophthora megakarya]|uniref:Uncharacterized protein n=1 Tax=Phytophthora megakarya TaxID=4795 RepID=A0A225WBJ4_9STRA|nr:hypothetical protein PHMEG_00012163 [Phytophthora megakarya]
MYGFPKDRFSFDLEANATGEHVIVRILKVVLERGNGSARYSRNSHFRMISPLATTKQNKQQPNVRYTQAQPPLTICEWGHYQPAYGDVKSARGGTAAASVETEGNHAGTTTVATPKGAKLGTWVRQAAYAKQDGRYIYSQARGCSDTGVVILTLSGPFDTNRNDIYNTVFPAVAMIMGCHECLE